jgi:hypothetical protein
MRKEMNKSVNLFFLLVMLLISACTLNSEQERNLNQSLSDYLLAKNECRMVNLVAFTYPELVASIKAEGDSSFMAYFNCSADSVYFDDPTIRSSVKKNKEIQVCYELRARKMNNVEFGTFKHELIAISHDNGNSWFFMDKKEYVNKSRISKLKKLIE